MFCTLTSGVNLIFDWISKRSNWLFRWTENFTACKPFIQIANGASNVLVCNMQLQCVWHASHMLDGFQFQPFSGENHVPSILRVLHSFIYFVSVKRLLEYIKATPNVLKKKKRKKKTSLSIANDMDYFCWINRKSEPTFIRSNWALE